MDREANMSKTPSDLTTSKLLEPLQNHCFRFLCAHRYVRNGLYPSELPVVMGCEGAGRVTAIGSAVRGLEIGDRVAFFEYGKGYTSHTVVHETACFKIPDGVDDAVATGALVQGLTAHYLSHSTFPLAAGHAALVHAASPPRTSLSSGRPARYESIQDLDVQR